MLYEHKCRKCGKPMKKIPIRRRDNTLVIEYYCENCEESITFYPDIDIFKYKKPSIF